MTLVSFAERVGAQRDRQADRGVESAIAVTGRLEVALGEIPQEARAELRPLESPHARVLRRLSGSHEPSPVHVATVRRDGFFELATPGAGPWRLRVLAPGYVPLERTILPAPAEQDLPPAKLIRAGRSEELRFVDPEGGPAVGSWVRLESTLENPERRRWMRETGWRRLAVSGWTDNNGGLRFLRSVDETLTFVADNDWGRARVGVGPRSTGEVQQLPWPEVARLRLRALDAAGRALPDAVFEVDGRPAGRANGLGVVEVSARRDARIRVRSSSGAETALRIDGDRWQNARSDVEALTLEAPARLRLAVVDQETGKAVPGSLVVMAQSTFRTDANGRLDIGVPPISSVLVGAYGYRWASLTSENLAELVQSSGRRRVTIALRPSSAMTGRVADPGGGPLGGVELRFVSERPVPERPVSEGSDETASEELAVSFARTRADGTFRVLDLVPETEYVLEARLPGYSDLDYELRSPSAGERLDSVLLEMLRPRPVFGWVVDGEDGDRPVAEARVQLFGQTALDPVRTDARGRFEIEHFGGTTASVLVQADGLAPAQVEGIDLPDAMLDQTPVELGTIVLDRGSELEVHVRREDGEPIAGALVELDANVYRRLRSRHANGVVPLGNSEGRANERARGSWAIADDWGRARLVNLSTGELHRVRARAAGFVVGVLDGLEVPRNQPAEIVLEEASSVSGRVTDASGAPIENAHVAVHSLDVLKKQPPGLYTRTSASGEFVIAGVPLGRQRVMARAVGNAEIDPVEVDLRAGVTVEGLELRVPPSGSLSGRIVDARGQVVSGVRVLCSGQMAVSDENGDFRLEHVRLGPQQVEVRASGRVTEFREAEIEPAGSWLEIRLSPGVLVSGRVIDGFGEPAEARLWLRPTQSGLAARESSNSDGSFVFAAVAPGRYRLTAQALDERSASLDVEVGEESVGDLELRLGGQATLRGKVLGLGPDELSRVRVGLRGPGSFIRISTDWEGRFSVDQVPNGKWTLAGSLEVSGGRLEAETQVVIESGTLDVVADLEFEPVDREAALSGQVLIEGRPAGAWLLLGNEENYWNTTANSLGEFQFPSVSPGRYDLTVAARDTSLTHARQIEVYGDERVTLRLGRAVVTGRVTDVSGEPVEGAILQVLGPYEPLGQRYTRRRSQQDGSFRIAVLLEQTMRLVVSRPGYSTWEGSIDAGEQFVDVVLDGSGAPVASTRQP